MLFLIISMKDCEACKTLCDLLLSMNHEVAVFNIDADNKKVRKFAEQLLIVKGVTPPAVPQLFVKQGEKTSLYNFKFLFVGLPENVEAEIERALKRDEFENRLKAYEFLNEISEDADSEIESDAVSE